MPKPSIIPQEPEERKAYFDAIFNKLLLLVKDGHNIYTSLKTLGIGSATFYRNISKTQLAELQLAKTSNTSYGVGSWSKNKRTDKF